MILTTKRIVPIIIIVLVGGILLSIALNTWKTESSKVPVKYSSGEFAGEYNPGDIRGSYSFADISDSFDISVDDLAKAFGVNRESDPSAVKAKDMEEMYGALSTGEIGTDSIRYFVALYTQRPYTPNEDTRLPASALSVLRSRVDEETINDLRSITVNLVDARATTPAEHVDDPDDTTVKGKTTFQELYDWGLSKEEIEKAIGMSVGKDGVTVRDHVVASGLEFSTAKSALQELVDTNVD